MGKIKYYFILVILILAVVAFKVQSVEEKPEIKTEEVISEIQEQDYSLEIKGVLNHFDSLLATEIKESGTIGAAIVITYKNQIALLKCYGVQKAGRQDSINKNTIFRLASVSKTISGVLAGVLSDEKIISLDDKIVDCIPGFRLKDDISTNTLTVRNVLSHTSGLIPHAYDNLIEEHVPFQTVMTRLKDVDISAHPGKMYGYQNVIFSLYDTVTATKTAKKFGEVLSEKVFVPFKMNDASVGFEAFEKNQNKAYPHYGSKGNFRALKLNDRYYSTLPAAGVNASISDLGNFLLTLLEDDSTVITKNAREIVFTPQVVSPLSRNYFVHWKNVKSKQYAIGWRTVEYKNRNVAYHGGYVKGYRAEIALCFNENVGIAFLSNSPNYLGTKVIPTFLDLLFEQKDSQVLHALKP
jgi:beta-lactamase class C